MVLLIPYAWPAFVTCGARRGPGAAQSRRPPCRCCPCSRCWPVCWCPAATRPRSRSSCWAALRRCRPAAGRPSRAGAIERRPGRPRPARWAAGGADPGGPARGRRVPLGSCRSSARPPDRGSCCAKRRRPYDAAYVETPLSAFRRFRDSSPGDLPNNAWHRAVPGQRGRRAGTVLRVAVLDRYDGTALVRRQRHQPDRFTDRFLLLSRRSTTPTPGEAEALHVLRPQPWDLPWVPTSARCRPSSSTTTTPGPSRSPTCATTGSPTTAVAPRRARRPRGLRQFFADPGRRPAAPRRAARRRCPTPRQLRRRGVPRRPGRRRGRRRQGGTQADAVERRPR